MNELKPFPRGKEPHSARSQPGGAQTDEVKKDGPWFDTFLVRNRFDPSATFAADDAIKLKSHQGTWWLFQREPGTTSSAGR